MKEKEFTDKDGDTLSIELLNSLVMFETEDSTDHTIMFFPPETIREIIEHLQTLVSPFRTIAEGRPEIGSMVFFREKEEDEYPMSAQYTGTEWLCAGGVRLRIDPTDLWMKIPQSTPKEE